MSQLSVVVGRFQVDYPTLGHQVLLRTANNMGNNNLLVFLACCRKDYRNPLDYKTRIDVQKMPLDTTKLSKPGILDLNKMADGSLKTIKISSLAPTHEDSVLRVYHDVSGRVDLRSENSFDKIRERARV